MLLPARRAWSLSSSVARAPQPEQAELFPYLSVLIPAYNEQERIGRTLQVYQDYLAAHPYWNQARSQIVVADDGSTDGTADLVNQWQQQGVVPISCICLPHNSGKGAALACGMAHILAQRPDGWILTTDADNSAPPSGLDALVQRAQVACNQQPSSNDRSMVVAGYRTYASAAPGRLVFRWGFRTVVRTAVGDLGVRDSQCGFKLYSPQAASVLFDDLHLPSWSHDVEVLYRARALGMTVLEEAVEWQDQEGSKLVASPGGVLAVSAQMLAQVVQLRWCYETGLWNLPERPL